MEDIYNLIDLIIWFGAGVYVGGIVQEMVCNRKSKLVRLTQRNSR